VVSHVGVKAPSKPGLAALAVAVLAGVAWAGDDQRGWGYLIDRLTADGVPRARAEAVFSDPRVDRFNGLLFGLAPRESSAPYRSFLKAGSLARARRCRHTYDEAFDTAQRMAGVPASVVAAIIHVESGCGRNTGSQRILPQLARLAMANEPENLSINIHRHLLFDDRSPAQVERLTRERGLYLEDTFYPEVRAVFTIADRENVDPLAIRGSGAGAFGIPQFLPRSYLRYGVDGNGDGRVDLYEADDAIASCAQYLSGHGWKPHMSVVERRRVLWSYNRSTAYIDTVLALAARLGGS
jgi:membrane-bound lytic murein transglycosylase B